MGCKQVSDKHSKQGVSKDIKSNRNYSHEDEIKIIERANVEIQKTDNEVKIALKLGARLVLEKPFPLKTKISAIIEEFKFEALDEIPKENELRWYVNNRPLNLNDDISSIVPQDSNKENIEIRVEVLGLPHLATNPAEIISRDTKLIGKPISEPFEVYVFNRETKHFHLDRYDSAILDRTEILNYTSLSAYCNGDNNLFLSGGEKDNIILGHFWSIDLKTKKIEKDAQGIIPKKQHSMIYIPNRYVFIVGGNDRRTLYYNIEEKSFVEWSDLLEDRVEPALAIIDDKYLYAFSNIKSRERYNVTFEKSNLRLSPQWELISPMMSPPDLEFNQKFFGVCDLTNERILFLGGNMMDKKYKMCYEFNTKNKVIQESNTPFQEFDFAEKTFLPFNEKYSFLIPHIHKNETRLIIFNRKENKTQPIEFSQMNSSMIANSKIKEALMSNNSTGMKKYELNMLTKNNGLATMVPSPKNHVVNNKIYINSNRANETPNSNINDRESLVIIGSNREDNYDQVIMPARASNNNSNIEREPKKVALDQDVQFNPSSKKSNDIDIDYDGQMNHRGTINANEMKLGKNDTIDLPKEQQQQQHLKNIKEPIKNLIPEQEEESSIKVKAVKNNEISRSYMIMNKSAVFKNKGHGLGGSVIRSSVFDFQNLQKLPMPEINKKSHHWQLLSSKIKISNDFNKDEIDDLKSLKVAGIAGKRELISDM